MKKTILMILAFFIVTQAYPEKPNIVLDLDDTILHGSSKELTKQHRFFSLDYFYIEDDSHEKYIAPAFLPEFLKFILQNFNLTFFSAGDEKRNKSVIEDIWLKAFENTVPENIKILSWHHLTEASRSDELQPSNDGICWFGNRKKDLRKIGDLDKTILVDDSPSWVLKGQKRNFLFVPPDDNFRTLLYIFNNHCSRDDNHCRENSVEDIIWSYLNSKYNALKILSYYKLVYVTGILDEALNHTSGLIPGLHETQFKNEKPLAHDGMKRLDYYIRGYKILKSFSNKKRFQHFPSVEKYFSNCEDFSCPNAGDKEL